MSSFVKKSARKLVTKCLLAMACYSLAIQAQSPMEALKLLKVDPPNWWTDLPKPMLLIRGEGLHDATFSLSDTALRVDKITTSENGHWAFLWLSSTPAKPETIAVRAQLGHHTSQLPYTFAARHAAAKGFSSADVMYLIMPDRFADGDPTNDKLANYRDPDDRSTARAYHGGDLRGIQDHLDYLQQLGITTIWTTPLYDNSAAQSGQTYHGYSATDMYNVDPHFGTLADYRALVAAAHARGMKVVLDTVPNHVGPDHPWAKDSPTPDWFHGTASSHTKVDDDFASVTDPKATAERRHVLLDGWFADILPDMNQDNPLVAQYLVQNAIWWIESANLDGLRIDTFPYVPRSFWHHYNDLLHTLYPHITDVGEVFNKDPHITSFFAGGQAHTGSDGTVDTLLDTPFDYPMYFALRASLTHQQPMTAIADVLKSDALYPHPERLVTFIGNHDVKRFLSEPGANPAALHLAYGLLASLRGMPQLYYGDEIDMTGDDDPDNRKDFPGGFAKDKTNAFTDAGRTEAQRSMHTWVTTLMQLRAHTPALQSGQQQVLFADKDTLAYARTTDASGNCSTSPQADRYLVIINNDVTPRDISVPANSGTISGCTSFTTVLADQASAHLTEGNVQLHLAGQQIAIFRAQPY